MNNYMAFPMPYPKDGVNSNVIWGWGWVVPTNSKNSDEAWKFIHAMTVDGERLLKELGFPPGNKGLGDFETANRSLHMQPTGLLLRALPSSSSTRSTPKLPTS